MKLIHLFCCRGTINFEEMYAGLSTLGYDPPLQLSNEDWDVISWHGALLDEKGGMNVDQFEQAMRWQLVLYAQRLMSHKMSQAVKVIEI